MDALKVKQNTENTDPNLKRWHVDCHRPGSSWTEVVEARELTLNEGAYCFWLGEYGELNRMIKAFPIQSTIIQLIED